MSAQVIYSFIDCGSLSSIKKLYKIFYANIINIIIFIPGIEPFLISEICKPLSI